jgi:hypothetical protein
LGARHSPDPERPAKIIRGIPLDAIPPRPDETSGAEYRRLIRAEQPTDLINGGVELCRDAATHLIPCGRVVMGVKGCDDPIEEWLRDHGKVHGYVLRRLEHELQPEPRRDARGTRQPGPPRRSAYQTRAGRRTCASGPSSNGPKDASGRAADQ